jgi:hypothetical protein
MCGRDKHYLTVCQGVDDEAKKFNNIDHRSGPVVMQIGRRTASQPTSTTSSTTTAATTSVNNSNSADQVNITSTKNE